MAVSGLCYGTKGKTCVGATRKQDLGMINTRHGLPWCVILAALLLAQTAWAQATKTTQPASLPDLLVTGSRLAQKPSIDAKPITRIDRATLLQSGSRSVGEYLQSLPFMSGAPLSTSVGARGQGGGLSRGIDTLELRGLGTQRTLILLNGRRFMPGGNGTAGVVDLGLLPLALVQRIEILKTGASVAYGADAVAGVVNIITRDELDGIEFSGKTGLSEHGDGELWDLSLVAGGRKDQSHWLAGVQYFDQAALSKGERAFSSRLLTVSGDDNQISPDGSSAPPHGNFRTSNGRMTLRAGEAGRQPGDFREFVSRGPDNDRFNFNPFEDLLQDSQRLSIFAGSRIALDEHTDYFVEAQWQQRRSDTQLGPLPLLTNRLAGVSVAADNLYNPFGEELSDARRRLVENGPRVFAQDNQAWRLLAGFAGEWSAWQWDLSIAFGRNRVEQSKSGDLRADRVALALGPSFEDASGQAVCGTLAQPIPGCVPLNLFGGPGSISPAMLDYVSSGLLQTTMQNEQRLANLNISRPLFALPGGDAAVALGYEFRNERAFDSPDTLVQAGNTTGAARARTAGQFDSHELYLQLALPLLADLPFVHALNLDLGWRGVDFSNFDTEQVYEAGLVFQPVADVSLRAAVGSAFRAPTIGELFGGLRQSNPAVADPCADFSQLNSAQRQRCVDQGVPTDGSFTQSGNETPQLGGGNQQLEPETSDIVSAGLSWQPQSLPGFRLSLDYYDIQIDDGIAALGANTLLAQCINNGIARFCDRIQRNAAGEISQVSSSLQNIAQETARGLDLELRLSHTVGAHDVQHWLLLSRVLERDLIAFDGAAPFVGVGEYDPDKFGAIPRWKGQYQLGWNHQAWSASYRLRWIGELSERGGEIASGTRRHVSSRLYHGVSLGYAWSNGAAVRVGIDNLADSQPPFLANADQANTDVATYPLLGRSGWMRVRWEF